MQPAGRQRAGCERGEMDSLDARLDALQRAGFFDAAGRSGLEAAMLVITEECGISRDDARVASLATHLAAALKRIAGGERVAPLDPSILADVLASPVSADAALIAERVLSAVKMKLPDTEMDYVLVHVSALLIALRADGEKGEQEEGAYCADMAAGLCRAPGALRK